MAKEEKSDKATAAAPAAVPAMVKVLVKQAISFGGQVIRPTVNGKKVIPVEAVIPREIAEAQGPDAVEILT